jgi:hypothetical protein
MSENAMLDTPAQAVAELTPGTAHGAVEIAAQSALSAAASAASAGAAAGAASAAAAVGTGEGETVTEAQALEAIFEARTTGNNKEADRLTALLEAARKAPAAFSSPGEFATGVGAGEAMGFSDGEAIPGLLAETESALGRSGAAAGAGAELAEVPEPNRLRITHLSEADKSDQIAIHALTKKGMPLAEAVQRILGPLGGAGAGVQSSASQAGAVSGQHAASHGAQQQQQQSAQEHFGRESGNTGGPGESVAGLEAMVMNLERQIDEIADSSGLYGADAARLTKQLSRANARLEAARIEAAIAERESARENGAFESQRAANEAAVVQQYPALSDPNSALFQLWYDLSLAAHSPAHPDHGKAQSVDGPAYFATKAAKILGARPGAARPAIPAVPAPLASQSRPATRPAAGNKGSAPLPPAKTAADLAREAEAAFESATTGRLETHRRAIGGILTR